MMDASARSVIGRIFDIQRFSIHDGPGIRTTVFCKGCPLRCLWCHNPESGDAARHLSYVASKCIGCGYCLRVCSQGAHQVTAAGAHVLDRGLCEVCGVCVEECYAQALELVGRDVTAGEVFDEVLRDRPFYETSGGGLTLSGGEPLLQPEFAEALLTAARQAGLHTAVETAAYVGYDRLVRLRDVVDLFLIDLKESDAERHRELTGVPNALILENVRRLHAAGAAILIRLPTVPGLNDQPARWEAMGRLAVELPGLLGFELMPYHQLGSGKRERMGLPGPDPVFASPSAETVAGWAAALRAQGATVVNAV